MVLELALALWLSIKTPIKPVEGFDLLSVLYQNVWIYITTCASWDYSRGGKKKQKEESPAYILHRWTPEKLRINTTPAVVHANLLSSVSIFELRRRFKGRKSVLIWKSQFFGLLNIFGTDELRRKDICSLSWKLPTCGRWTWLRRLSASAAAFPADGGGAERRRRRFPEWLWRSEGSAGYLWTRGSRDIHHVRSGSTTIAGDDISKVLFYVTWAFLNHCRVEFYCPGW